MPVKLNPTSSLDHQQARIEIIPLIDVMFFLLASFMLVSLSMVRIRSINVSLPTATLATIRTPSDFVDISVDRTGLAYLDKKPVGDHELFAVMTQRERLDPSLRVLISGDENARHGDIIRVLNLLRASGIEKVAFEVRAPGKPGDFGNPRKPPGTPGTAGIRTSP